MESFRTIYDISAESGSQLTGYPFELLISAALITAGTWQLIIRKRSVDPKPGRIVKPTLLIICGLVFASIDLFSVAERNELTHKYQSGRFAVVEGIVTVTHEEPEGGHSKGDMVTIGDRTFEISFYDGSPGYHVSIAHGGALKAGVYARVSYSNSRIVKVEVR